MHVCCGECQSCWGERQCSEVFVQANVCVCDVDVAGLPVCVGACGYSAMDIHLSHRTNKHIDRPLLYTVGHKKRQLALHLLRLARLKVFNGY